MQSQGSGGARGAGPLPTVELTEHVIRQSGILASQLIAHPERGKVTDDREAFSDHVVGHTRSGCAIN